MLLVPAAAFSDFILALHVLAVVIGFGVTFTYPIIAAAARRADPQVTPWVWGMIRRLDRYVVNPGLLVVLVAGIYLAADEHRFSAFFVQWGFGAVIVIGAIVGGYMIPREGRLEDLAARDLAASSASRAGATSADVASTGAVTWSPEYEKVRKQFQTMGAILSLIVIVTVFVMATHAGA